MLDTMRQLVEQLNIYAYHYYTLDDPIVTDSEYDKLYDRLVQMEKEYKFVLLDSPTRRVGGELLSAFKKHTHVTPLWSLDKAQSIEELREWYGRAERLRKRGLDEGMTLPELSFVVEYKFDGLTVNLTYEGGMLVTAATRGNGEVGEEITTQVKTIRNVPLSIGYAGFLEVQGEALMPLSALSAYNKVADEPLKNARNAAAGALRNLDPSETEKRKLKVFAYNVGTMEPPIPEFHSHLESLKFLEEEHFPVNSYHPLLHTLEELEDAILYIKEHRHQLDYLTDGVVIKINDLKTREYMGYTNKFPRWAIAYKFEAEEVQTIVKGVRWQVGRTGKVTPVASLEPISISGALVQSATLNNVGDMKRKNVRIGSTVIVRRSNEVIPEIMGSIGENEHTKEVEIPEFCPACGTKLQEEGAYIKCPNSLSCRPQLVHRLIHYCQRNAMDIEGIRDKTAEALVDTLGLTKAYELYDLTLHDLLQLPLFGEKRAQNLLDAIAAAKERSLDRFIFALGIGEVGQKTARDLAEHFETFEAMEKASFQQFMEVEGVGEVTAENMEGFFQDPHIIQSLEGLRERGVRALPMKKPSKEGYFAGMKVVLTGAIEGYTRDELKDRILAEGGSISSSVSKNTDAVIVGEKPGSKYTKAKELGIRIIEQDELYAIWQKDGE
ncbi:MAG: NAD-dependent DNA ligase LigA [Tissierellia bacterium]|nr:NAD-dependent DNA ligase LigA [Tissierellia bacterium]